MRSELDGLLSFFSFLDLTPSSSRREQEDSYLNPPTHRHSWPREYDIYVRDAFFSNNFPFFHLSL